MNAPEHLQRPGSVPPTGQELGTLVQAVYHEAPQPQRERQHQREQAPGSVVELQERNVRPELQREEEVG